MYSMHSTHSEVFDTCYEQFDVHTNGWDDPARKIQISHSVITILFLKWICTRRLRGLKLLFSTIHFNSECLRAMDGSLFALKSDTLERWGHSQSDRGFERLLHHNFWTHDLLHTRFPAEDRDIRSESANFSARNDYSERYFRILLYLYSCLRARKWMTINTKLVYRLEFFLRISHKQ